MDGFGEEEIKALSRAILDTHWSFNPKVAGACQPLLTQVSCLCREDEWLKKTGEEEHSGSWWKSGLRNAFLAVLSRVSNLFQDCIDANPTYQYTVDDFSSLYAELYWFTKLLELPRDSTNVDRWKFLQEAGKLSVDDAIHSVLKALLLPPEQEMDHLRAYQIDFARLQWITPRSPLRARDFQGVYELHVEGYEGQKFAGKVIPVWNNWEEIRNLLKLAHPNIVKVLGWSDGGTPGYAVLIMELMDKDLRVWIDTQHPSKECEHSRFVTKTRFNWGYQAVALDILMQGAQGMRYVHSCNFAHRDLKAQNLLVKQEKGNTGFVTAKVADFGVAKETPDGRFSTEKQGTTFWRAPEVLNGIEGQYSYSNKVDVWSFGVIAWEVLTGRVPKHAAPLEWSEEERKKFVHPYLMGCIERCWEVDPIKRPSFDSICWTLRHVKGLMLVNKGVYHASAAALSGESIQHLRVAHERFEYRLDDWWMTYLMEKLNPRRSIVSTLNILTQGTDIRDVQNFLNQLPLGQHSFLFCDCPFPHHQAGPDFRDPLNASLSSTSSSSHGSDTPGNGASIDDPVAQELCSPAALYVAAQWASSFAASQLQRQKSRAKVTSNNIIFFFQSLAVHLHRGHGRAICRKIKQDLRFYES